MSFTVDGAVLAGSQLGRLDHPRVGQDVLKGDSHVHCGGFHEKKADRQTFLERAPCPLNLFLSLSWMISMSMIVYSVNCLGMAKLPNGLLKNEDALMSATERWIFVCVSDNG